MNWVAWRMLIGDRAKYWGTVFGVAFGTLLITQQTSIFVSLMKRTASQILDIREAQVWVMEQEVQNADEVVPLTDFDLYRVRGVPGVEWASRLFKGLVQAQVEDGSFRQVVLMGLDDDSLAGAPTSMVLGDVQDLRHPEAIIVDKAGVEYLWPNVPPRLGLELEINDRRAVLVGICEASAPFQTFPIVFTRYQQARVFAPPQRNSLSFVIAGVAAGESAEVVCSRIREATGLKALTRNEFIWETIAYYLRSTGIPINFGITIALGFIVGAAIAGQTFYLFVLENERQFGALKAMGLTNWRLIGMVLVQASTVGLMGYGLGVGMAAVFFESTQNVAHLAGFFMPWQVMAIAAGLVGAIITMTSFVSLRRVLTLEPAIVFR